MVLIAAACCASPERARAYLNGIDVYNGDGTVNWAAVKSGGYDFAFVKATEGVNAHDSRFTANMSGANAAGVYVGPYHFAHAESLSPQGTVRFEEYEGGAFAYDSPLQPNRDAWFDATKEAVDFIKRIRPYYTQTGNTHYLPPVSDIEQKFMPNLTAARKKEFISNWAQLFSDAVYDALGVRPILYVSKSSANENFTATVAGQQPFWIAWYKGTGTTSPPIPGPLPQGDTPNFPAWSFWQWSDGSDSIALANPVPGTTGEKDRNVFSGTLQQLAAMRVQLVQGDYNHNGFVDAADFVRWRKDMSATPTAKYTAYSEAVLAADGNNSGKVEATDYNTWRSQFGKKLSASPDPELEPSIVPEPSSIALVVCIAVYNIFRRAPRKSSPATH